eukprot:m.107676 g.107676  ORF g.107676 m.107676 type:complete len:396 (-) comp9179_c0_seq1:7944-9131(-)
MPPIRFRAVFYRQTGTPETKVLVFEEGSTVGELKRSVEGSFGLSQSTPYTAMVGHPPWSLHDKQDKLLLTECGIKQGGRIVVRLEEDVKRAKFESVKIQEQLNSESENIKKEQEHQLSSSTTEVFVDKYTPRRVSVLSDNSCMFSSLIYLLDCPTFGVAGINQESTMQLRHMVASLVKSNPKKFTEAILGRSVDDYIHWITNKDRWGGYIELTALATFFGVTIHAIDIQTVRVDTYGGDNISAVAMQEEGESKEEREKGERRCDDNGDSSVVTADKRDGMAAAQTCCFLLYDGVHYDPLVLARGKDVVVGMCDKGKTKLSEPMDVVKTFSVNDCGVFDQMVAFAKELHELRQFTNVNSFAIMCLDCQKGLTGSTDAQHHAQQTGHFNFCETEGLK